MVDLSASSTARMSCRPPRRRSRSMLRPRPTLQLAAVLLPLLLGVFDNQRQTFPRTAGTSETARAAKSWSFFSTVDAFPFQAILTTSLSPVRRKRQQLRQPNLSFRNGDVTKFRVVKKKRKRRREEKVNGQQLLSSQQATTAPFLVDTQTSATMSPVSLAATSATGAANATSATASSWSSEAAAVAATVTSSEDVLLQPPNRDEMIAHAAVLRQSILKQQLELQKLERQIICCTTAPSATAAASVTASSQSTLASSSLSIFEHPLESFVRTTRQARTTFRNSWNVLLRKLNRVQKGIGKDNQKYKDVNDYVFSQTATGLRILDGLAKNPTKTIKHLIADPTTPTLLPHIPSIYARLDRLEAHVDPILEKVLNNKQHLQSIEPYFDEIMERFDDIEPHMPWILKNIDILAPYTGLLLQHVDELLLYTDGDDDGEWEQYELAEQVLPYLEFYVSRLDKVGPHLPLLRPHLPKLLRKNRIAKITPHIDRLFARGYLNLGTSANLDVLLFWVGWTLNVPLLPRLFFAIPGSPRFVTFLASRLPKRFVRGYCSDVTCSIDGNYGTSWNRLSKDWVAK